MEMILLDWTRMGSFYCLTGAVSEGDGWRVVRPLPAKYTAAGVRKIGWSPFLLDGHSRWDVFELIGTQAAAPEPPHLEDVWVRELRPRYRSATPAQRRAILQATLAPPSGDPFGEPLATTHTAAYLRPGSGTRSLVTVVVPTAAVRFTASQRQGAAQTDHRVKLPVPGLNGRTLPVKDHHLLNQAELAGDDPAVQERALSRAVRQMGDRLAVRLGLSRDFAPGGASSAGLCWLMADGFFSYTDPQP